MPLGATFDYVVVGAGTAGCVVASRMAAMGASVPSGRLVGGSSTINAMIYCRGHRASYDRWQDLAGSDAPAWNYDALLPYFR